jgi:hypothetical protein
MNWQTHRAVGNQLFHGCFRYILTVPYGTPFLKAALTLEVLIFVIKCLIEEYGSLITMLIDARELS